MSFNEFKKALTPIPNKSVKETIKEVNGYIEQFNHGLKKLDYGDF